MSLWKLLTATYDGTNTDKVRIDGSTNSLQCIDYEHHEIHGNSHFFLEGQTELGNGTVLDFCVTTNNSAKWVHVVFDYESELDLQFDFYELAAWDADGTYATQFANNRAKSFSGVHDGGDNEAVMADASQSFGVDDLIGWTIHNITKNEYAVVTDNDGTSVTGVLSGGEDWDDDDQYEINKSLTIISVDNTVTATGILMASSRAGSGTNPNKGVPGGQSRSEELVLRPNTNYLWRFTSGAASNHFTYKAEWYEHTDKH